MRQINLDRQTVIFIVLAAILAGELFILFPWELRKINKFTERIGKIAEQINSVENEWPQKDRYLENQKRVKEEIKKTREEFIITNQESKPLSFISAHSKDFEIEIQSLSPQELQTYVSTKFGKFKYLPIKVKAEGKFNNLVMFLNYLHNSQYFFEVKELTILSGSPFNPIEMVICGAIAVK
ncbi:MAG: hypothetical protein ABIE75_02695 [Candidatus Omnitrophota bacterium]